VTTARLKPGSFLDTAIATSLAGVLVALLCWPVGSPVPALGPDASWVAGLYMALAQVLQFGTEFVFTYGPLGFLEQPVLYDGGLWIVAILYRGLIYVGLAIALVWSARRSMPLILAAAALYALLVVGYLEGSVVLLAFVLCVAGLSDRPPAGAPYSLAVFGGVLGAVELLAKLNFGLAIVVMFAIAMVGVCEWRRALPLFAGVLFVALLVLWLATGQSLAHVPEFVANSAEVLSGYSRDMGVNVSEVGWQRPLAVVAIGLLVAAATVSSIGEPRRRGAAVILLTATFSYLTFKQSFVRQGLGNASDFFPMMFGAALALAWRLPTRIGPLPRLPAVVLLAPLATFAIIALPTPSLWASLEPGDHVDALRQDLRSLASSAERDRLQEEGRHSLTLSYRIDRPTLALLRGRRIDVEPWEIGAAWAYDLRWQPLPVIQGYQAYTPALDALNARTLAGHDRPTAILRQNTLAFPGFDPSIDNRELSWDPPETARAMLCNYSAVRTTPRWQVLFPIRNRCGKARIIARTSANTGETIRVPAPLPGQIVFARVHGLGVDGLEELRALLYRARQRTATVDGQSRRVVPDTAGDGLLLRAGGRVDFPAPFGLAPRARTIAFDVAGDPGRPIEVVIYAQRVVAEQTPSQCDINGSFRRC